MPRSAYQCEDCSKLFEDIVPRRYCSRACALNARSWWKPEKFWTRKRVTESGCWLYGGLVDQNGYGVVKAGGVPTRAHRYAYQLAKGSIPDGLHVCHTCDTPPCINPDHLYVGTNADNMRDRRERGRYATGDAHPYAKLTQAQVAEIRRTHRSRHKDFGTVALAQKYGVHRTYITSIVLRRVRTRESLCHEQAREDVA